MKHKKYIIFILLLLSLHAQSQYMGVPPIENYNKREYQGATQNWSINQSNLGLMYFANNIGVLEYDGERWNTYSVDNKSVVRTVAIDKKNRIWLGAYDDFGYIDTLKNGNIGFKSLKKLVPKKDQDFGEVWRIYSTVYGFYIQAFTHLFKMENDTTLKVLAANKDFQFSFYLKERIFIQDRNKGLMELRGSQFYLLPDGDLFIHRNEVWGMLPLEGTNILIATTQNGLYLYDNFNIRPIKTPLDNFFKKNTIFSVIKTYDHKFVFGTVNAGIVVTDSLYNPLLYINKKTGLQDNTVLSLFEDKNHEIWAGLDKGISHIRLNSPFQLIGESFGVPGTGYTSIKFKDKLYLGTNQGLYYIPLSEFYNNLSPNRKFKPVSGTVGQVWTLQIIDKQLFCGHDKGTFIIENDKAKVISKTNGAWTFIQPAGYPDKLLVGTYAYILVLEKRNGQWFFKNKIKGMHESFRVMEQDNDGSFWLSHGYKGIYHFRINKELDSIYNIRFYDSKDGLPSNYSNYVYKFQDSIIFSTTKGIYSFKNNQFNPSQHFNTFFKHLNNIRKPFVDEKGNVWFIQDGVPSYLKKKGKNYTLVSQVFQSLHNTLFREFEHIDLLDSSYLLIGNENGFLISDVQSLNNKVKKFNTLIRSVELTGRNDSLRNYNFSLGQKSSLEFSADENDIEIFYSATLYNKKRDLKYQFWLKGYEKDVSTWTSNSKKEYTNLSPGNYRFMVRARDFNGKTTDWTSLDIKILPPWYETVWAIIFYIIFILIISWIGVTLLFKKIDKEKIRMEKEKERELSRQAKEHLIQNDKIQQKIIELKNEKLKAELKQDKYKMELKNKELASIAVQIMHKNETLGVIKEKLTEVKRNLSGAALKEINLLLKNIEADVDLEDSWENFKMHFESIHSDFFKRLHSSYPNLSPKDLKLCAYIRMNLNTKEIALLSNITVRGVEIGRYRLRKKLGLERGQNLFDFLMGI